MVCTENGTYIAVRQRAPHHCTRSPPEAMPSQIGVFFLPQPVYLIAYLTLKMEETGSPQKSVSFYQTTWNHVPEDQLQVA